MEWKASTKKDNNAVLIPERWLHLHYYEALNILFRMENSLRVFVYIILKNSTQDKWIETMLQLPDDKQLTIAAASRAKIKQAEGYGYLGYPINSPLMYLNSGELTRLITSEAYWNIFKNYFKGTKEIIKTKFDEISTVRNALAHFRPLKNDDIELIKQNIKHAFIGIEECLTEVMNTSNVVPTNTSSEWYKHLTKLGNELCSIQMYQSKREEWIRLEISYTCPIIKTNKYGNEYYTYKILNLLSPAIVKIGEFSNLEKFCTYVTEYVPYIFLEENIKEEITPNFKKITSIIFSKAILNANYGIIRDTIQNLLNKIKEESDLIKEDNLARGMLVESIQSSARLNKGKNNNWWDFDTTNLKCVFDENDPSEYWGDIGIDKSDFIAGSTRYPWMPSDISKEEFPF